MTSGTFPSTTDPERGVIQRVDDVRDFLNWVLGDTEIVFVVKKRFH